MDVFNRMNDKTVTPAHVVQTAAESYLFGPDTPCPVLVEPGVLDRVWIVSGENAGGKSLFCRALQSLARKEGDKADKIEIMRVGMEARTTSGIQRALMFGDEQTDSTGKISISCLLAGINTARKRENPHWLILDEPDIGVGEGYRHAIGELFAKFALDLPELTLGFIVVTHSREIASPMVAAGASSVRVGDDLRPVAEWIANGDLPKTVADLEALAGRSTHRFRAVNQAMREASAPGQGTRAP